MSDSFIKGMIGAIMSDKDKKVKHTVKMTPEMLKKWNELSAVTKKQSDLDSQRTNLRKRFWIYVEDELKEYGSMGVSDDDKSIKVYEDED